MRNYELMIILSTEIDERTANDTLGQMLQVITKGGGTVDQVNVWGKRRLAYEIKKHSDGIYAVVNMTATPELAKELDRQLGLSELVLRTKLMRPDAH